MYNNSVRQYRLQFTEIQSGEITEGCRHACRNAFRKKQHLKWALTVFKVAEVKATQAKEQPKGLLFYPTSSYLHLTNPLANTIRFKKASSVTPPSDLKFSSLSFWYNCYLQHSLWHILIPHYRPFLFDLTAICLYIVIEHVLSAKLNSTQQPLLLSVI